MTTSADQGSIAEVGAPTELPPDPVDAARPGRWTSVVILVATGLLALLNAHAIGGWLDELTPGPVNTPLRGPVARLTDRTQAAGLDAPRAGMRSLWERARAARFGREEPGQHGAADAP